MEDAPVTKCSLDGWFSYYFFNHSVHLVCDGSDSWTFWFLFLFYSDCKKKPKGSVITTITNQMYRWSSQQFCKDNVSTISTIKVMITAIIRKPLFRNWSNCWDQNYSLCNLHFWKIVFMSLIRYLTQVYTIEWCTTGLVSCHLMLLNTSNATCMYS